MRVSARAIVMGTALLAVGVLAVGGPPWRRGRAAEASIDASAERDPRAAIFVQRGCSECHAIAALGVKAATDVGPDLTFAYVDVGNRYQVNLESFLDQPTGVMRLMLASHLHLTSADRDSILHILKAVYEEHLAEMDEQNPSFPPTTPRPRARPER